MKPLVKLFFLCRRKDGLSHEAYAEHLLRGHVPIALRHENMSSHTADSLAA